jgi:hypothetical protein
VKCLFIGTLHQHAVTGRVSALKAAGCELSLLNCGNPTQWPDPYPVEEVRIAGDLHDTYYRGGGGGYKRQYLREYCRALGLCKEEEGIVHQLRMIIDEIQPDFAVLHYGTIAIHYARILKRIFPALPVIEILNVFPLKCREFETYPILKGRWLEMRSYRSWLKHVDGVICASEEMTEYVKSKLGIDDDRILIAPDFLPAGFQAKTVAATEEDKPPSPSVIFLGAPER